LHDRQVGRLFTLEDPTGIDTGLPIGVGCHRARPLAHPGGAGLLWAINGGRLLELHRDWAVIELAANGSRHVFELPQAR
jgi:hypothetical protein